MSKPVGDRDDATAAGRWSGRLGEGAPIRADQYGPHVSLQSLPGPIIWAQPTWAHVFPNGPAQVEHYIDRRDPHTRASPSLVVVVAAASPSAIGAMDLAPGRRARLLVVLALVVLAALAARSSAEVITLTEETFSDKIKEKDMVWFVKFCVPWCKHCKNLGALWEDLGKVMEGADEIEIGQVDCGVSKPVCSKVDIHSYPTFKVFYEGEEVAKYKGPRNVESLKNFVLDEAEKAGEAKLQDS